MNELVRVLRSRMYALTTILGARSSIRIALFCTMYEDDFSTTGGHMYGDVTRDVLRTRQDRSFPSLNF